MVHYCFFFESITDSVTTYPYFRCWTRDTGLTLWVGTCRNYVKSLFSRVDLKNNFDFLLYSKNILKHPLLSRFLGNSPKHQILSNFQPTVGQWSMCLNSLATDSLTALCSQLSNSLDAVFGIFFHTSRSSLISYLLKIKYARLSLTNNPKNLLQ